jgi:hypothetical protein
MTASLDTLTQRVGALDAKFYQLQTQVQLLESQVTDIGSTRVSSH